MDKCINNLHYTICQKCKHDIPFHMVLCDIFLGMNVSHKPTFYHRCRHKLECLQYMVKQVL